MRLFNRVFGERRKINFTTAMERQRLSRTMPGQTGALAALRGGYIVN